MNTHESKSFAIPFLIGIISFSLIIFQLHLINILSLIQWYHFAYMVIAIALLGFGTSGTIISIFKERLLKKIDVLLPILVLLTQIFITISVALSQTELFYFDSYTLFTNLTYLIKLPTFYILFFLPFFFGSLIIGLLFVKYVETIGLLYFANMFGSGLGAVITLFLMWGIPPEDQSPIISSISLILSLIALSKYSKKNYYLILLGGLAALVLINVVPVSLKISEYKGLSKILKLPGSEIIKRDYSPQGELDIVNSPMLRYSPGLSMLYPDEIEISNSAFNNGNWKGPLFRNDSCKTSTFSYSTLNLPYILDKRDDVLILYSGTGNYIHQAVDNNAAHIVAVEHNSRLTDLLKFDYAHLIDSVYNHPKVSINNLFPRSYIMSSNEKFDLIQLPVIDAFGGTSGLTSLKEDYLMTKESFSEIFSMLNDAGVISISTWIDYPYKNSLKIISTLVETFSDLGLNPQKHIVAVKNWNTITIIGKKTPVSKEEKKNVINFCNKLSFDPVLLGGFELKNRNYYNKLQDTLLFTYIDDILTSPKKRKNLYANYPFDIEPATDNSPYFSQFIKWESINLLAETYGRSLVPFFEIGYLLLYLTFIQILLISISLIIVPLLFFRKHYSELNKKPIIQIETSRIFFYFSGIGLGYIFFEILCIQKFQLYFGNIIYSASFVIGLLLISSGFGSFFSENIRNKWISSRRIFLAIILFISCSLIIIDIIIKLTIDFNLIAKVIISIIIIFPAGFLMGMPFPLGLKIIGKFSIIHTPWAWGINGVFSVMGVVLATIISVEIGSLWLVIFTLLSYIISMLSRIGAVSNAAPVS